MQKYLLNFTLTYSTKVYQAIVPAKDFHEAASKAMDWLNGRKYEQNPYIVETHQNIFNATVERFEIEALGLVANLWSMAKRDLIDSFEGELRPEELELQMALMRHVEVVPEITKQLEKVYGFTPQEAFHFGVKVLGK